MTGIKDAGITGGCACGAVRFRFEGPPMLAGACHCRACQYAAGGAPTYVVGAARDSFEITQGEPKIYTSRGDSGAPVGRAFCAQCGTPLYSIPGAETPFVPVKVGALDDPSGFRPQFHIYMDAAQPWHRVEEGAVRFPKAPPGA
jgi:hypothetical protein